MKLPDWQQKSLRCNLKSLKGIVKSERTEKASLGVERPKKSEHRKKYNNRLIKSGMEKILLHSKSYKTFTPFNYLFQEKILYILFFFKINVMVLFSRIKE